MKDDFYYCNFKDKNVELRAFDKRLIRKFTMKAKVVNAQVTGAGKDANVAITIVGGKTFIYKADGRLIRKG